MSTKPAPVALTAAMLVQRAHGLPPDTHGMPAVHRYPSGLAHACADLASRLHRLAKGCERASVAECNGELANGQRQRLMIQQGSVLGCKCADEQVAKFCDRIDKQVDRISEELRPFGLKARNDGDPRGYSLYLVSTDPLVPIPHNGIDPDAWIIE